MAYKYKISKTKAREFAKQMQEIENFCAEHNIHASASNDSYYFSINGINYRVSNHTIESSNAKAYNFLGEQVREKYHDDKRKENVVYIHASKTRIIEIYNDLLNGYKLNGKGQRIWHL